MEKRDNNSSSDLEHKLEIVENKLVFIEEQYESAIRFFKITLTSISGFFGVISILVVVLSLFSKSEFVKNDGPLSVKRGFIKSDWEKLLTDLPVSYLIKRKWAFRWLIVIRSTD